MLSEAAHPRFDFARFFSRVGGLTAVGAIVVGGAIVGSSVLVDAKRKPANPPAGGEITANLFIASPQTSDGSAGCGTGPERNYTDALTNNQVCKAGTASQGTAWDVACAAATGGNSVGIRPGVYSVETDSGGGYLMGGPQAQGWSAAPYDCSDGLGADYNPNWKEQGVAEGSLTNWVHFKPAVDCAGTPNISFSETQIGARNTFATANWHLIIGSKPGDTTSPGGECFNFNRSLYIIDRGCGGEPPGVENISVGCARPKNLIIRGRSVTQKMQIAGIELISPRNTWLDHMDLGPTIQCAGVNGPYTSWPSSFDFKCKTAAAGGAYFESWMAELGTNITGCHPIAIEGVQGTAGRCAGFFDRGANARQEPYIHGGSFGSYKDIRISDVNLHDGQARGTGGDIHPGCWMFDGVWGQPGLPSHNMVLDGVSCERQIIGVQHADSGVTVQNSYFGCPVTDLPNSTPQGEWDECGGFTNVHVGCRTDNDASCVTSNVLYRYNVFFTMGTPQFTGLCFACQTITPTFSNVRAIANIFINAPLGGCSATVICANNSFRNATANGSNATTLTCDPTIDSDMQTSDHLWRETTTLDPRLSGSTCNLPFLNQTTLNAACSCTDYSLDHTIDGTTRSTTATRPGVDE